MTTIRYLSICFGVMTLTNGSIGDPAWAAGPSRQSGRAPGAKQVPVRFVRTQRRPGEIRTIPPWGTAVRPCYEVLASGEPRNWQKSDLQMRQLNALAARVGEQEARKIFDGLDPFCRANYGQQVIVVGASANTKTGSVGVSSGGVVAGQELSDFLQGRGPMPSAMQQIVNNAQQDGRSVPSGKGLEFARVMKSLAPDIAAEVLVKVVQDSAIRGNQSPTTQKLFQLFETARSMPGSFTSKETGNNALNLQKKTDHGLMDITLIPGDGLAFRLESQKSGCGYAAVLKKNPRGAGVECTISELVPEPNGDPNRFVPRGATYSTTATDMQSFVETCGL